MADEMIYIPMRYRVDLGRTINTTPLNTLFAMGDNQAHRFELTITHGSVAENLTGCEVKGKFVSFSNNMTVILTGSVENGNAVVTLKQPCYTQLGRFALVIQIVKDGMKTSVFYGDGYMRNTSTDNAIIDEDYIVYDTDVLLSKIQEIETAITGANAAIANANAAAEHVDANMDAKITARVDKTLSVENGIADAKTVGNEIGSLKDDLVDLSDKAGVKIITGWSEKSRKIVVTSNEKLNLNVTIDSSDFTFRNVLVACEENDEFIINANGGNQSPLVFVDSEYNILSKLNDKCTNYKAVAPKNSAYVFIQKSDDTTLQSYIGAYFSEKFDHISNEIVLLNDNIGTGKNKFDGKTESGFINESGEIIQHVSFSTTTNYMKVKSGERIRIAQDGNINSNFYCIAAYDKNKKFILSLSNLNNGYFKYYDVPDGVSYIRACFKKSSENICIYDSTIDDLYYADSEYHKALDDTFRITSNQIENKAIERIGVGIECLDFTEKSVNLLDKAKAVKGYLENTSYGVVSPHETIRVTDFIYLKADTLYSISNPRNNYINLYNLRFEYIKSVQLSTVQSPVNCCQYTPDEDCYVRLCYNNQSILDNAMVVEGSIFPSVYVPYFCKIKKSAIYGMSDDSIDFYLPEKIYVASGRTIDLYYSQFFLQADRYHIRCMCDVGIPYENRFAISCNDTMIGKTYPLTVTVYNDNLEVVISKTVNIKVVSNAISNLNILPIGDSLTQKPWLPEIQNLSNGNISFIGQSNYSLNDADGNVRTGGCQGVPGWTAGNYLTTNSPFYNSNDGTYSLSNYCNAYLDGQRPDAMIVWLGTNALQLDPTGNATEIKNVVDMLRNDGNTIPLFVLNTIYKSTQDAIGRQSNVEGYKSANGSMKYMEDKKVFNLMNVLHYYFAGYENLQIVPCAITMDAVNGFGAIEVNINSRCTRKKLIPSDSVHPQPDGYYQISDTVFSAICGYYNSN